MWLLSKARDSMQPTRSNLRRPANYTFTQSSGAVSHPFLHHPHSPNNLSRPRFVHLASCLHGTSFRLRFSASRSHGTYLSPSSSSRGQVIRICTMAMAEIRSWLPNSSSRDFSTCPDQDYLRQLPCSIRLLGLDQIDCFVSTR